METECVDCVICAEPCLALCVFSCGHFTCYTCGLRVHSINKGNCPICRVESKEVVITRTLSASEEHFTTEEMGGIRHMAVLDRHLNCYIDGRDLAREVAKLYENVCPIATCWSHGDQDPFNATWMLKEHLHTDHTIDYCQICLDHRPAFLCEQVTYCEKALQQHLEGRCTLDSSSFAGHPPCRFCKKKRFYDGEMLLKHLQQNHFTCDVCNRSQFTFTFYDNRAKLNLHFERNHFFCDHPDCSHMDLMLRVFGTEIDLAAHKQRVHGVKAKVAFTTGSFVPNARSGDGDAGTSDGPATGANANAVQIIFDHIQHRETVEMLPTKSAPGKKSRKTQAKSADAFIGYAPAGNGLPSHFRQQGVLWQLMRSAPPGRSDQAPPPNAAGGSRASYSKGERGGGAARGRGGGRSNPIDASDLFSGIPQNPQDRQRRLDRILEEQLTSPVAYGQFRAFTKEFLESKILTLEYYNRVVHFFPTPEIFNEVFPLLVATTPAEGKRSALEAMWRMKMAPEMQRMEKTRQEEAKAREERAVLERMQVDFNREGYAGNTEGGAAQSNNAWNKTSGKAKVVKNAWAVPASSPVSQFSPTQASPAFSAPPREFPTLTEAHGVTDAELYPSLPTTGIRRTFGAGKKNANARNQKKPNAWFQ